jgi:hypothetical protein
MHRAGKLSVATVLAFVGIAAGLTGTLLQSRTARAERMIDLNEPLRSETPSTGKPLAVD